MKMQSVNALAQTGLNDFLFGDIGIEANGMMLSVVSLFARRGNDPWVEAGRLAALSKAAAVESLAGTIAAMPGGHWNLVDASPIAVRLIDLLPSAANSRVPQSANAATRWPVPRTPTIIVLVLLALGAAYGLATTIADNRAVSVDDAPTTVPLR